MFRKWLKTIFLNSRTAFDPQIITYDLSTIAELTSHVGFRRSGRTAVFHFDEEDYSRQQQVTEIITSYLYTGSYNIIMVVYEDLSLISDAVNSFKFSFTILLIF